MWVSECGGPIFELPLREVEADRRRGCGEARIGMGACAFLASLIYLLPGHVLVPGPVSAFWPSERRAWLICVSRKRIRITGMSPSGLNIVSASSSHSRRRRWSLQARGLPSPGPFRCHHRRCRADTHYERNEENSQPVLERELRHVSPRTAHSVHRLHLPLC